MKPRMHFSIPLALLVAAGYAMGQGTRPGDEGDLLLRVNAPVTIAAGETVSTVWVIGGDLDVQGTVKDAVIVMGGTARISGEVRGGVVVAGGALELAPTARIDEDVVLYRSTLSRADGATVGGKVEVTRGVAFGQFFALGFWLSTSLVVVAFGLILAAVAGGSLNRGADVMLHQPGASTLTALVAWIGIPLLAALSFATVIGIPLGIAILVFLLPTLGFLGVVVSGTALGRLLLREPSLSTMPEHPYREVAYGLILLQVVAFVPVLGGLVMVLAATIGAGAVLYRVWQGMKGQPAPSLRPVTAH